MIKSIDTVVRADNTIQLPKSVLRQLLIRKGDRVRLSFDTNLKDKCFKISYENEEELFDEDFYCVPKRIFDNCGIVYDDIKILMNDGSITLTSSEAIVGALGKEVIACLIEQDVNLNLLADDLVAYMNDEMIEGNEEHKEDL